MKGENPNVILFPVTVATIQPSKNCILLPLTVTVTQPTPVPVYSADATPLLSVTSVTISPLKLNCNSKSSTGSPESSRTVAVTVLDSPTVIYSLSTVKVISNAETGV